MAAQKPREIAVHILKRHGEGFRTRGPNLNDEDGVRPVHGSAPTFIEHLLEEELAQQPVSAADRRLIQELTFGVIRWQATLDWLISQKTAGRTQTRLLQILLRLGLYQMFWLDKIPDYAAVNETIELARTLGLGPKSGFINAVLRGYLREREPTEKKLEQLKLDDPPLGLSHPAWLCERWDTRWGREQMRQLLEWNNIPPPTFARVNTLKTDVEQLAAIWEKEEVRFVPGRFDWIPSDLVFKLESHPPLARLKSFQDGFFYVQDPSTLLAVTMLDPKGGEAILDLCAAPGGKTTYIAQRLANRGLVVAQDPHIMRRQMVKQNCERLGVTCVRLSAPTDDITPGLSMPYDRVLVDAPCSNTGVMRRRVDLRWRIRATEIKRLAAAQLDLMQSAAQQLKPGGVLLYSTCSLEPEENEQVVEKFRAAHEGFSLEEERTLLPFREGVDGAYVARLRRVT